MYGKKTIDDVHSALAGLPEGITAAFNLGHADVFPSTSGKENAAKYLMSKFDADPSSSFLLCDDDNDIGVASCMHCSLPLPSCFMWSHGRDQRLLVPWYVLSEDMSIQRSAISVLCLAKLCAVITRSLLGVQENVANTALSQLHAGWQDFQLASHSCTRRTLQQLSRHVNGLT